MMDNSSFPGQSLDNASLLQQLVFYRTYSRLDLDKGRRETWQEALDRLMSYLMFREDPVRLPNYESMKLVRDHIDSLRVFPSMRLLSAAGGACDAENATNFNCAYMTFGGASDFGDLCYLLMCGCGVGYSVERSSHDLRAHRDPEGAQYAHIIEDSRSGWAEAIRALMRYHLEGGNRPQFYYHAIRPEGAVLKTFGGRASGPAVLQLCLERLDDILTQVPQGQKLSSLQLFDMCCFIAECVQAGGSRRSATIALFDLDDNEMIHCKSPDNFRPWRANANISAVIYDHSDIGNIRHILASGIATGEPGLVNRSALWRRASMFQREADPHIGVNPCGEVALNPYQFCNLTEVNVSRVNLGSADARAGAAYSVAALSCIQTRFTNFASHLNPKWAFNTKLDNLMGVSITGLMDNLFATLPNIRAFKNDVKTAIYDFIRNSFGGFGKSGFYGYRTTALTTIKPSGTVGVMANCSQGLHPRLSPYVAREIRMASHDPMAHMLIQKGVPHNVASNGDPIFRLLQETDPSSYIGIPSATSQLLLRSTLEDYWCDHQPSQTLYVRNSEIDTVMEALGCSRGIANLTGMTFFNLDELEKLKELYGYLPVTPLTATEAEGLREQTKDIAIDFANDIKDLKESVGNNLASGCQGGTSCSL